MMDGFEKKTLTFYTMLCNAFRDEEDYETAIEKLSLNIGDDVLENLTAMLVAMKILCDRICPKLSENGDLIDFTHLLNRLAIQHCFSEQIPDEDAQEDE